MIEFRPVGFGWGDLYEVSREGVVRRIGTIRPIGSICDGYVRLQLSRNGKHEGFSAHEIVAEAFIGPRPEGYQIDHINGVRNDNRAGNLRYCTPKENIGYTIERDAHVSGVRNGLAALTERDVLFIKTAFVNGGRYWGAQEIARKFGVDRKTVTEAAARSRYKKEAEQPIDASVIADWKAWAAGRSERRSRPVSEREDGMQTPWGEVSAEALAIIEEGKKRFGVKTNADLLRAILAAAGQKP